MNYRALEQHFRGRDLLQQAISKYDLPITAFYCTVISGALLLFFAGATLGAILAVHEEAILTFAIGSSLFLIALATTACVYWEHVSARRATLLSTLECYMNAQADIAHHANREAP
jgi:hypothetical protein|tara:strand:+ start:3963 stop:4307 length:345 start_codon:yes stop_codon:yes gene_type:complete